MGQVPRGSRRRQVASESSPSALILESAFTSLPSMAQRVYPWLPARWLCKFRFTSIDHVGTLTCPKLFFHGTGDRVVPLEEGQRLFEAAADPKRFVELEGGHDDAFLVSRSRYLRTVQELFGRARPLRNHLGARTSSARITPALALRA